MHDDPAEVIRFPMRRVRQALGEHTLAYKQPVVTGDPIFVERIGRKPRGSIYLMCVIIWIVCMVLFAVFFPSFGGGRLLITLAAAGITGVPLFLLLFMFGMMGQLIRVSLVIEQHAEVLICRRSDGTRSCALELLNPVIVVNAVESRTQPNSLAFALPKGIAREGYAVWLSLTADDIQRFLMLEWCETEARALMRMDVWQERLSAREASGKDLWTLPAKIYWVPM